MSLSDKRISIGESIGQEDVWCYDEIDVREAVKELKVKLCGDLNDENNVEGHINEGIIDKIFGEKLI